MKILLLEDLNYVEHLALESVFLPSTPEVGTFTTNVVRKRKGETLDVDRDNDSEAGEHKDGSTWFVLRETRQRLSISNRNFSIIRGKIPP